MSIEAARAASSQLSEHPEWQEKLGLASSDDDLMATFFAFCESIGADVSKEDVQEFFTEMKAAVTAGTGPGDELSDEELEAVAGGKKKKKKKDSAPTDTSTDEREEFQTINSTHETVGWWCVCCSNTQSRISCTDVAL